MQSEAIIVDLERFARDGRLGALRLGDDRARVMNFFGPPTNVLNGYVVDNAPVWKYGDAEMYFDGDHLWMIHFDRFDVPTGGGRLRLMPWVLRRSLLLNDLQAALRSAGITFVTMPDLPNPGFARVTTSAGVSFLLQVEGDADELGLCQFGCTATR